MTRLLIYTMHWYSKLKAATITINFITGKRDAILQESPSMQKYFQGFPQHLFLWENPFLISTKRKFFFISNKTHTQRTTHTGNYNT